MTCCMGAKYGNWCDDVEIILEDPETKKKYCLFHAPAELKIGFNSFIAKSFHRRVQNSSGTKISFRGAIFPDFINIDVENIYDIDLRDTEFHKNLTFFGVNFHNQALFQDMKIKGHLSLSNVTFKNITNVTFKDIYVGETTDLIGICCENDFTLNNINCTHNITVIFSAQPTVLYLENIRCADVFIQGHQQDSSTKRVMVSVSQDMQDYSLAFDNILFDSPPLEFIKATCSFSNCTFEYFRGFKRNFSSPLTFTSCTFNQIDLSPATLRSLFFFSCNFPKNKNNRLELFNYFETFSNKHKEETYRTLKAKAQQNESNMECSDWHYWEKFFCEKRIFTEGTFFEWLILRLYRLFSDYGESAGKAFSWLLFFILLPVIFGLLFPVEPSGNSSTISPVVNAALQFIPLATSAPKDAGLIRALQLFWQILITFQATLLGFALRNRYRR